MDGYGTDGGGLGSPLVERARRADWPGLLALWEASVRATHHFLAEADLTAIRERLLPEYFSQVELLCLRGPGGDLRAFLGVAEERVEMLFVHPDHLGRGLGGILARHAIYELGCTKVDVNEQNPRALAFYLRLGFKVGGRSELDGQGKPFPLLHLRLDAPDPEAEP